MQSSSDNFSEILTVRIELIDPSTWRPLSHWIFEGKRQITIGRATDQDVTISDPVVSRNHACLIFRSGAWYLTSTGRHGVLVLDQLITEYAAVSGLCFRLGPQGPTLKFTLGGVLEDVRATFNFDEEPIEVESVDQYELDRAKLQREVTEIAESDYFRELQMLAIEMRAKREKRAE